MPWFNCSRSGSTGVLLLLLFFTLLFSSCGVHKRVGVFNDPKYEEVYKEGKKANQAVIRLKPTRDTLQYYRYRLQPGDELRVRILNLPPELAEGSYELEADARYIVNIDGYVHLPLAGRLFVQDKATEEVRRKLFEVYAAYFNQPNVEVMVSNLKVFVFGESDQQGVVILPTERTHLLEALALSGGVPQYAKSDKIKIIRGNLNDPQIIWVNLNYISALREEDLIMRSGDIIYLETRTIPLLLREAAPYLVFVNIITILPTLYLVFRTL